MALAMNALAKRAKTVKTAKATSPMKRDATIIADPMKIIETRRKPKRLANIDANVCSSHVMGNQ
jgi:hypothetical protein